MYTASLYAALASVIYNKHNSLVSFVSLFHAFMYLLHPVLLFFLLLIQAGQWIIMFSDGSGLTSTLFWIKIAWGTTSLQPSKHCFRAWCNSKTQGIWHVFHSLLGQSATVVLLIVWSCNKLLHTVPLRHSTRWIHFHGGSLWHVILASSYLLTETGQVFRCLGI